MLACSDGEKTGRLVHPSKDHSLEPANSNDNHQDDREDPLRSLLRHPFMPAGLAGAPSQGGKQMSSL